MREGGQLSYCCCGSSFSPYYLATVSVLTRGAFISLSPLFFVPSATEFFSKQIMSHGTDEPLTWSACHTWLALLLLWWMPGTTVHHGNVTVTLLFLWPHLPSQSFRYSLHKRKHLLSSFGNFTLPFLILAIFLPHTPISINPPTNSFSLTTPSALTAMNSPVTPQHSPKSPDRSS